MAVIDNGILVGKGHGRKERVSTVTLVSDQSGRLAAASSGGNPLFGLVEGEWNRCASNACTAIRIVGTRRESRQHYGGY